MVWLITGLVVHFVPYIAFMVAFVWQEGYTWRDKEYWTMLLRGLVWEIFIIYTILDALGESK